MSGSSPLRSLALLCCCASAFTLSGCGGGTKGIKINGKLVLPSGVKLEKEDTLEVVLISVDQPSVIRALGQVNHSALSFTIQGTEKKGLPAGKYKVAVSCLPYAGSSGAIDRKKTLEAAFEPFSTNKTTLTTELSGSGEQTITVDLPSNTVSK